MQKKLSPKRKQQGIIIPNGVILEPHENATVVKLAEYGYKIELIRPSLTPKNKNPDFLMDNLTWEMKSPAGSSKTTLEHMFKKASLQSSNIIFDLRRIKMNEQLALQILEQRFTQSSRSRRLKIILKSGDLLDYQK